MSGATSDNTDIISSIPSGIALSSFADNKWGVCVDTLANCESSNFYSISRQDNPRTMRNVTLTASDNYAVNTTVDVTYAATISNSLLADTYTGMQLISATAEDKQFFESITYMQEMTKAVCDSEPTPSATETNVPTARLIDSRDGKYYWVSKLADGNCWMTQNLDLDLSTAKTLTPDDSDVSANWTPTNNTSTNFRSGNTDNTAVWSLDAGYYVVNKPLSGYACSPAAVSIATCSNASSLTNVESDYAADFEATGSGNDLQAVDKTNYKYDAHYLLGNYYTYNAATAGTGASLTSGNATDSICPKGWRLPIGNSATVNGSYARLTDIYGLTAVVADDLEKLGSAPLYLHKASGYAYSGTSGGLYGIGTVTYYHTSTAHSAGASYHVPVDGSGFYLTLGHSNYFRTSVRCIANFEDTLDDITYMQEMTSEVCAATRTPSASETTTVPTKQLIDSRDGKKYWVAKLADGNCWMTQNLAYDLSTDVALTPDDSDVSTNWTPPYSSYTAHTSTLNPGFYELSWNYLQNYLVVRPGLASTGVCNNAETLSGCVGINRLAVVNSSYTDDYVAMGTGSTQTEINESLVTVDTTNLKYDAHYLAGNMYTYMAATAGTGSNTLNANADDSICPKGWRMPDGNSSSSGSFTYLINAYGLPTNGTATKAQAGVLGTAPLYFAPSPGLWYNSSTSRLHISFGDYYSGSWFTRTGGTTTANTYRLSYGVAAIYADSATPKSFGLTVRCLAK